MLSSLIALLRALTWAARLFALGGLGGVISVYVLIAEPFGPPTTLGAALKSGGCLGVGFLLMLAGLFGGPRADDDDSGPPQTA